MRKRNVLVLSIMMIAGAIWGWKCGLNAREGLSDLAMANIEALTQKVEEGAKGYGSTHFPCYDIVYYGGVYNAIENGKYRATCWINPNSKKSCHSHNCEYCTSD